MPRRKQIQPKRMKWEEGAGGEEGGEGKEVCSEEETNTITDNDADATPTPTSTPPPLQVPVQLQSASDTEDNSGDTQNENTCIDFDEQSLVDNRKVKNLNVKSDLIVTRERMSECDVSLKSTQNKVKHNDNSKSCHGMPTSKLSEKEKERERESRKRQLSQYKSTPSKQMEQTDDCSSQAPLDFSIKTQASSSKKSKQNGPTISKESVSHDHTRGDSPLDLSCSYKRPSDLIKSSKSSSLTSLAKVARFDAANSSSWNYSANRSSSTLLSPPKQQQSHKHSHNDMNMSISNLWNGKITKNMMMNSKSSSSMVSPSSSPQAPSSSNSPSSSMRGSNHGHGSAGRQNPWQTQWINRSSEQTRDVFTCVWCKDSFRSLAEMTDHMKKSPRCGMAGMQQAASSSATATSASATHSNTSTPPGAPTPTSPHQQHQVTASASSSTSSSHPKEPISSSVLAKNNVGLPRKLVRGQDVWLGRGAEQTRQILKCMWCGQSFKTLADMTTHMRVTQHYTNIISQEQIISWRTPEDKLTQAQVNAVLTCKVCDEAFGSLKELSYHMVKNAHYKEHILRSITEGGHGRRRQTRERRKKSLPVRKLLELERRSESNPPEKASEDNDSGSSSATGSTSATSGSQLITCDDCHEKVDAKNFISHIKLCKEQVKSAMRSLKSDNKSPERVKSPVSSSSSRSASPRRAQTESPQINIKSESNLESEGGKSGVSEKKDNSNLTHAKTSENKEESSGAGFGSVLSAIERLIEKSFDSKSRKSQSTGILQRLGIDEEVCPPWQNMPQTQMPWSRNGGVNDYFSSARASSRSSGRQSSSPMPVDMFSKESNGSMSSPHTSDGCDDDDSNSCSSITNNIINNNISANEKQSLQNMNMHQPLTATSMMTNKKLSFPISSLISQSENKNDDDIEQHLASSRKDDRISHTHSPNNSHNSDEHSQSGNSDPPSPSLPSPSTSPHYNETSNKQDSTISMYEKCAAEASDEDAKSSFRSEREESPYKMIEEKKVSRHKASKSSRSSQSPSSQRKRNSSDDNNGKESENKDTFHPLMQLQKLLDKTDSGSKNKSCSPSLVSSTTSGVGVSSSSLLAFSWACSDAATAVHSTNSGTSASVGSSEEKTTKGDLHLMKCAFCETHFISKGAYRHHLSKMHFIKGDKHNSELSNNSTNNNNNTNHHTSHHTSENSHRESTGSAASNSAAGGSSTESGAANNASSTTESPHSKFLKYTELAKQLSSKYV